MARIRDEEIERLEKDPLERLVTGFGIELARHGSNLIGRGPFHDDRTPSLVVIPGTNLYHMGRLRPPAGRNPHNGRVYRTSHHTNHKTIAQAKVLSIAIAVSFTQTL